MLRYHSAPSGHWLLAASVSANAEGRVLVVAAPDDPAEVEHIWSLVSSNTSVQGILDELARNGISSAPEFALLAWSGELATASATLTTIVRGAAVVSASVDGETVEVDGRSATTWAERRLESVASIDIKLGVDVAALATLPLGSGVAWVDRVAISGIGSATPPVSASAPRARTITPEAATPPVELAKPSAKSTPEPALVSPPALPIVAPRADAIEDSTIAEFTMASAPDDDESVAAEVLVVDEPVVVEPEAFGYDSLFEETMVRSIEDAAVRPEEEDEHAEAAPSAATPAPVSGDHDGMTMMGADFAALR